MKKLESLKTASSKRNPQSATQNNENIGGDQSKYASCAPTIRKNLEFDKENSDIPI